VGCIFLKKDGNSCLFLLPRKGDEMTPLEIIKEVQKQTANVSAKGGGNA